MTPSPHLSRLRLSLMVLATGAACTSAYLYNPDEGKVGAVDRSVQIRGEFCTEGVNDVIRPINILLVLQTSSGMQKFDPNGTGAKAILSILDALPQVPDVSLGVMTFAGDVTWLTDPTAPICNQGAPPGGNPGFRQITTMDSFCQQNLKEAILNYALGGADGGVFRDATDFLKPLDTILTVISEDLSVRQANAGSGALPIRPRYEVVFVSAGQPHIDEDCEIEPRCKAIASLASGNAAEIHLNTVYVQTALVSTCNPDAGPAPTIGGGCLNVQGCYSDFGCGIVDVQCDSQRMQSMAQLGNGLFRSLRSGEPVNYLNFSLGGVKRQFIIDQALAYNINARPDSPIDQPDSDGDGLSDSEELNLVLNTIPCPGTLPPCCSTASAAAGTCPAGEPTCCDNVPSPTDPTKVDTDGDGFSDGLEVYMHRLNGTFQFDPSPRPSGSNIDPGCSASLVGVDADQDHVLDCDELLLGMSATTWDSDGDGLPDGAEWLANPIGAANPVLVTQPTSPDADADPDRDQLTNAVELRGHTDPGTADVANLTSTAARYEVTLEPTPNPVVDGGGGQQCYSLQIDNVLLVPTLDTGEGPGWNHIFLAIAEVAEDDPGMQPIYRVVELKARYPLGGIKTPPDGVLSVKPTDFQLRK